MNQSGRSKHMQSAGPFKKAKSIELSRPCLYTTPTNPLTFAPRDGIWTRRRRLPFGAGRVQPLGRGPAGGRTGPRGWRGETIRARAIRAKSIARASGLTRFSGSHVATGNDGGRHLRAPESLALAVCLVPRVCYCTNGPPTITSH